MCVRVCLRERKRERERESLVGMNSCRFEIYFALVSVVWFTKVTFMLCVLLQQSNFSRSPTFVVIVAEV